VALVFFSCCEVGCYRTSGITNDGIDELTERVSLLVSAHTPSAWMNEPCRFCCSVANCAKSCSQSGSPFRAGVREDVAMAVSGHRTRAVFDRYNTSDDDLRQARQTQEHLNAQPAARKVVMIGAKE
jgi:hypothetical protein